MKSGVLDKNVDVHSTNSVIFVRLPRPTHGCSCWRPRSLDTKRLTAVYSSIYSLYSSANQGQQTSETKIKKCKTAWHREINRKTWIPVNLRIHQSTCMLARHMTKRASLLSLGEPGTAPSLHCRYAPLSDWMWESMASLWRSSKNSCQPGGSFTLSPSLLQKLLPTTSNHQLLSALCAAKKCTCRMSRLLCAQTWKSGNGDRPWRSKAVSAVVQNQLAAISTKQEQSEERTPNLGSTKMFIIRHIALPTLLHVISYIKINVIPLCLQALINLIWFVLPSSANIEDKHVLWSSQSQTFPNLFVFCIMEVFLNFLNHNHHHMPLLCCMVFGRYSEVFPQTRNCFPPPQYKNPTSKKHMSTLDFNNPSWLNKIYSPLNLKDHPSAKKNVNQTKITPWQKIISPHTMITM